MRNNDRARQEAEQPVIVYVPGEPTPKGRPRFLVTSSGIVRVVTPERTRIAEKVLAWQYKAAMAGRPPLAGLLDVQMVFGRKRHGRIDLDNFQKLALDAGNGILFHDDSQIMAIEALMHFVADPYTCITVRPWRQQPVELP